MNLQTSGNDPLADPKKAMKNSPKYCRGPVAVPTLASLVSFHNLTAQDDPAALREKVAELEKRLDELEGEEGQDRKLERLREDNKANTRKRASEDRRHYKPEELAEIETL